jgi:ferredoxin-NADP reductase
MLAGGVGLAPCLGMLREAAARGDRRRFHLVFANRTQAQIVFRDEIAALAQRLDLRVDYILSEPPAGWDGATGQMDEATLLPLLAEARGDLAGTVCFLCGPPPMVGAATDALAALGVPGGNVVTEKFDYD